MLDLPTAFWHEFVTFLTKDAAAVPDSLRTLVIGAKVGTDRPVSPPTWPDHADQLPARRVPRRPMVAAMSASRMSPTWSIANGAEMNVSSRGHGPAISKGFSSAICSVEITAQ